MLGIEPRTLCMLDKPPAELQPTPPPFSLPGENTSSFSLEPDNLGKAIHLGGPWSEGCNHRPGSGEAVCHRLSGGLSSASYRFTINLVCQSSQGAQLLRTSRKQAVPERQSGKGACGLRTQGLRNGEDKGQHSQAGVTGCGEDRLLGLCLLIWNLLTSQSQT